RFELFFFFQAEDGIRDFHVTGVQTCALPIYKLKVENGSANGDFFIPSSLNTGIYRLIGYTNFSRNNKQDSYVQKNIYVLNTFVRSEERRVGKECRFRWSGGDAIDT